MAQCTAHSKRSGNQCKREAIPGATVCHMHGASAPQVRAKAAERVALARAEAEATKIGITRRDIHPAEALIELVQYTAGEVDYWRHTVSLIDDTDLIWGTTRVKDGGDDRGTTQEAKPHIAYVMLERASDRLATYAAAALKAGCDERRVRLAEAQGAAVALAIRTILDQLHLTPPQLELVPTIVPAALRSLAAQEATPA